MAAVKKDESKSTGQNAATPNAPEKAPETTATKAVVKVKGLRVIASKDGFRRAGREWHGTTEVPLDEFTNEQIKQLLKEPRLAVQEIEIEG